jgi:hypothetical protein
MKYSNLETMNASSIRWSAGVSKFEHGARHAMLQLTWRISMLQLCYSLNALIEAKVSPWLAGYNHHPLLHSSLPCHCQPLALLLPLHHVPLSCMQLLSYQACYLLPSISSPAPHPHCIPCSIKCSAFLVHPRSEPKSRATLQQIIHPDQGRDIGLSESSDVWFTLSCELYTYNADIYMMSICIFFDVPQVESRVSLPYHMTCNTFQCGGQIYVGGSKIHALTTRHPSQLLWKPSKCSPITNLHM